MRYNEKIEDDLKSSYSLNFLLAEFEEINDLDRDLKVIDNQLNCDIFETRNFKNRYYYKHISTCLTNFQNHDQDK